MKHLYFCKCGRTVSKNTDPETEKETILNRIKACRDLHKENSMDNNYILAQREDNGILYALKFDTFWFRDKHQGKWIVSDFAAQQYEKASRKDEHLSKAAWLSSGMFAIPMDDYEVPDELVNSIRALSRKDVKKCTNTEPALNADAAATTEVPAVRMQPAEETQTTLEIVEDANTSESKPSGEPSPSTSSDLACPAETAPAAQSPSGAEPASLVPFDTTGLDDRTVADLELAAREYANGKKMTEMGLRRMADGVAIAHDALCGTVVAICDNGRFAKKEDTFRAWCASIGITKDTAYRLLQVAALFDKSSPNEQKVLEELSPSLLYAAAKPSAPAELVEAVKSGDITSHKQYKELLEQLKAATARADGMVEEINRRDAKINDLIACTEEADRRTEEEERKCKDLQRELDAARASNAGSNALLADEQQRRQKADEARIAAEKRAAEAEKSLEGARHVVEASKRRDEKARSEIESLRAQLADLKAKPIEAPVVDAEELDRMAAEKADAIVEQRLAELAPGEDALHNAQDAVILAVRIIDSISQLLMPHMGVLDNDQIMDACETISRATAKLNGGLAGCLKN